MKQRVLAQHSLLLLHLFLVSQPFPPAQPPSLVSSPQCHERRACLSRAAPAAPRQPSTVASSAGVEVTPVVTPLASSPWSFFGPYPKFPGADRRALLDLAALESRCLPSCYLTAGSFPSQLKVGPHVEKVKIEQNHFSFLLFPKSVPVIWILVIAGVVAL